MLKKLVKKKAKRNNEKKIKNVDVINEYHHLNSMNQVITKMIQMLPFIMKNAVDKLNVVIDMVIVI